MKQLLRGLPWKPVGWLSGAFRRRFPKYAKIPQVRGVFLRLGTFLGVGLKRDQRRPSILRVPLILRHTYRSTNGKTPAPIDQWLTVFKSGFHPCRIPSINIWLWVSKAKHRVAKQHRWKGPKACGPYPGGTTSDPYKSRPRSPLPRFLSPRLRVVPLRGGQHVVPV